MKPWIPLFCVLLLIAFPAAAEEGRNAFQRGLEASTDARFEQALAEFRKARAAGFDAPALDYNLGVVLFRLERLDEAAEAFGRAARSDSLAGPAYYNLGLVALAMEREEDAGDAFRSALQVARTGEIQELARRQLEALPGESPAVPGRRGRAWIGLDAGYDSNPALEAENRAIAADGAGFLGMTAWGELPVGPADGPDLRLEGVADLRAYPDESDANLLVLEAGTTWHTGWRRWGLRPGLRAGIVRLRDDTVERLLAVALEAERPLPVAPRLELGVELGHIRGGDGFPQLDGDRLQLHAGLRDRRAVIPWRLRYTLGHEDRKGVDGDDVFASRSPVRQGFRVTLQPRFDADTWLDLSAGYRYSAYRERDRFADGTEQRRVDHRTTARVGINRLIGGDWATSLRIGWVDNRSRIDTYRYQRGEVMVGVDRSF